MSGLPSATTSHLSTQRREQQEALAAVRGQWGRMGSEFDGSWSLIVGSLVAITSAAQRRIAQSSFDYVPDVLDDLGSPEAIGPSVQTSVEPLVGVTGSGTVLDEALYASVITAKIARGNGFSVHESLSRGENRLMGRVSLALSDTGRFAERVRLAPTRVAYYERALTLPSCSRCIILAGRLYRMEQPFQRHPRCDCRHLPVGEAGEVEETDPLELFASLSESEQDRIFTKGGAEAIRNGADMNQVVNARRGMYTSRTGSRKWKFTSEGMTRRGWWGRDQLMGDKYRGGRYRRSSRRRLMPEEIQRISTGKENYLSLLRDHGYII